jgi:hypothetical protein
MMGPGVERSHLSMVVRVTVNMPDTDFLFLFAFLF